MLDPSDPALVHRISGDSNPATHVLIVGIGTYVGPHHQPPQLTSPPVSARSVCDWFIKDFNHPGRELRSVALLLSEPSSATYVNPKTSGQSLVPRGSKKEVKDAVAAWLTRAEGNPENLAVFYFCGHGAAGGGQSVLLLRDFGASVKSPFDGAINVPTFVANMATQKVNRQLFVLDACQEQHPWLSAGVPPAGDHLVDSDPWARIGTPGLLLQHVLFSTLPGAKAFGDSNAPSIFTNALLKAMRGAAGTPALGQWWVATNPLVTATHYLIQRSSTQSPVFQHPGVWNAHFEVHLPKRLKIPAFVSCRSRTAREEADLACRRNGTLLRRCKAADRHPPGADWEVMLPPKRQYTFAASFPPGSVHRPIAMDDIVYPPLTPIELRV